MATPISAQATPSSRVDINEEISIKVELNSELEVDDIEAEIWLDEVTGHPDHVGAEYSIASPSMSNYSMVDVFSLGRETNLSAFSYGASTNKYSTGFNQSHAGDSSDSETGFLVHNSLIKFNDKSRKTLNR